MDELNQSWLSYHGYHVELVGWELTVAAMGRTQALINQDLETCEYFIGMVWKRWGTPPAKDGRYQSGFEEEFETSLKRHRETSKPEISLFFKAIDPADKQDPGPQLQLVIDFKKKITDAQELLFEEFSTVADFEARIRRSIFTYVRRLIGQEAAASIAGLQAATDVDGTEQSASTKANAPQHENPLSQEGAQFLRELIAKTDSPGSGDPPTPVEVGRFRLLGTLLRVDAEDPLLAVHDANRLFAARNDLTLSIRERRCLLDAGLAEYENENVPLWHWLATIDGRDELFWRSIVGRSEAVKTGALSAMRDLGEGIPVDGEHKRSIYVSYFLGNDVPAPRRAAALRYLADFGITDDLSFIRAELDRNDYQTSAASIEAIIKITLRDSRAKAFATLLELQPDTIDLQLLVSLFSNTAAIHNGELKAGLSHKSSAVRLASARALIARGNLQQSLAEQMLEDSSHDVRLEAMRELTRRGRAFADDEAERLLVVREQSKGLFAFGTATVNNDWLTEFRAWQRRSASDQELEEGGSIFDRDREFILDERNFSRRGDALRVAIKNRYKDKFDAALVEITNKAGESHALIEDTRKLEQFVRQRHTRQGLDIICRRGDGHDLAMVRDLMDSGFVSYSEDEVNFLKRHGEWEDIPRIVTALSRPSPSKPGSSGLLGFIISPSSSNYAIAAKAIYSLGRDRADELFAIDMPADLRRQLIVEMPDAGFSKLSDATVTECFRSKDGSVRKAGALKAVKALSRARQQRLLDSYLQESYRFYNVILWLDLGASMSREIARTAAQRLLSRIWRNAG